MIKYLYQEGSPMIDITQDIQPLTTFRNNSVKFIRHLKKSKRPIVLTVNGKPEAVLQSAEEYQRLLNIIARADEAEALRQAEEDVREGRTRPARTVFAEMRKKYDIPR
jgi:prevent-host-death family protein